MKKTIKMTNGEIYNTAKALIDGFTSAEDLSYPVKVNFLMQKNMKKLLSLSQEIDKSREDIIRKYGEPDPDNKDQIRVVPGSENEKLAISDLNDLFNIEQEVPVYMINLNLFDNINMTQAQVAAISFMIDDGEEEDKKE